MRALVTGGAGQIGSHIVDALLRRGWEATVLDNLDPVAHPYGRPPWVPNDARFIEGDVTDAGVMATPNSRFAMPYPRSYTSAPFWLTPRLHPGESGLSNFSKSLSTLAVMLL